MNILFATGTMGMSVGVGNEPFCEVSQWLEHLSISWHVVYAGLEWVVPPEPTSKRWNAASMAKHKKGHQKIEQAV